MEQRPPFPHVIALGGYAGSGKSTMSAALVTRIPAVVAEIDVLWKKELGIGLYETAAPGSYTPERRQKVLAQYDALCREALEGGHALIAQKVFARPAERQDIEDLAKAHNAGFHGFWLEAPLDILKKRVRDRVSVSDAPEAAVDKQAAIDTGALTWRRINMNRNLQGAVADIIRIICQGPPRAFTF